MTNIYWIDLFCGAGGTSTGIHLAGSKVIACVNHDANAIASHKENHPEAIHFTEDIRDFKVVLKLKKIVQELRIKDPSCIICIWASLECTNFSKAKGGMARDADSRTLADHMPMYLIELLVDYFWIENVREFMSWGPLDENGKPISTKNGRDYLKWIEGIRKLGFRSDDRILNSANYGAYQSRERLFIQFASSDLPITWPEQTHSKNGTSTSMFPMNKWKPVKEVLDLEDHGLTIFNRKKSLSENTLKRIYAGLEKFVAKGENIYLKKYFSGRPAGKVTSINTPSGTITSFGSQAVVTACHLHTYNGNSVLRDIESPSPVLGTKDRIAKVDVNFLLDYQYKSNPHDLNKPSPTLCTKDKFAKVDVVFVDQQYGNSKPCSIEIPMNTLTGNPKFALVNPQFIMNQYSGGGQTTDIKGPCSSLTSVTKQNLISVSPYMINANSSTSGPVDIENPSPTITQRRHVLINPSWFGHSTSIDSPSPTIIARQDKSPLYILSAENSPIYLIVYQEDSEMMVKIKSFMVQYGITDIKIRMLKIPELLQIQGFPQNYKLLGTKTEQKKYIGNAVEVNQARAITENMKNELNNYFKQKAA